MNKPNTDGLPAVAITEQELMNVLRSSLYPGASEDSIKLVLGYCKAAGLDPMQKPVHIVPMWDNKAKMMRDVIMPGIGSYRARAARSGQYAGISEPEFGPEVTESHEGLTVSYPAWCRVTVKRLLTNGSVADFSATERWLENYAPKNKTTRAPNDMWTRRPYAQLAKCAEAQALRKAFPELGAQPTAEEMYGKSFYDSTASIDADTGEITAPKVASKELPLYTDDQLRKNLPAWQTALDEGRITSEKIIAKITSGYRLSAEQAERIRGLKQEKPDEYMDESVSDFIDEMESAEYQGAQQ